MDIFGSREILYLTFHEIHSSASFQMSVVFEMKLHLFHTLYAKRAYISEQGSESVANVQLLFVVTQTKGNNQCPTVSFHPFQLINSSFLSIWGQNRDLALQSFLGIFLESP